MNETIVIGGSCSSNNPCKYCHGPTLQYDPTRTYRSQYLFLMEPYTARLGTSKNILIAIVLAGVLRLCAHRISTSFPSPSRVRGMSFKIWTCYSPALADFLMMHLFACRATWFSKRPKRSRMLLCWSRESTVINCVHARIWLKPSRKWSIPFFTLNYSPITIKPHRSI